MGDFHVIFSAGQAARDLWAFGEDELSERALQMPEAALPELWQTAATYYDADYPLPVSGRRITLGHVVAFAAMNHLLGGLRPLARNRRRPAKTTPEHIEAAAVPLPPMRYHELLEQWRGKTEDGKRRRLFGRRHT